MSLIMSIIVTALVGTFYHAAMHIHHVQIINVQIDSNMELVVLI